MFKRIKRGIKILKKRRVKSFFLFLYKFFVWKIFWGEKSPGRKIIEYFAVRNSQKLIKKLKNFNSQDLKTIFYFACNFYFGLFKPIQEKEEFTELLKIFQEKKPKYILEIGTAYGGSLFCFCRLAPNDAILISIDLPGGPFGGGYPEWKIPVYQAFKRENQKLYLLRKDSHQKETLKEVLKILNGNQIDFLFIDGDHTYEGVKKDFEMYAPLVKKDGLIVFHDIAPTGEPEYAGMVPYFWNEIKNDFYYKEFVKDLHQSGSGIGVIAK